MDLSNTIKKLISDTKESKIIWKRISRLSYGFIRSEIFFEIYQIGEGNKPNFKLIIKKESTEKTILKIDGANDNVRKELNELYLVVKKCEYENKAKLMNDIIRDKDGDNDNLKTEQKSDIHDAIELLFEFVANDSKADITRIVAGYEKGKLSFYELDLTEETVIRYLNIVSINDLLIYNQ